jgi:hypothetical protein
VTSIVLGIFFVVVLGAFGYSVVYTLLTIMALVQIEHSSIISKIRSSDGGYALDADSEKTLKYYLRSVNRCIYLFMGAFGGAAALILINLFHKHLPLR